MNLQVQPWKNVCFQKHFSKYDVFVDINGFRLKLVVCDDEIQHLVKLGRSVYMSRTDATAKLSELDGKHHAVFDLRMPL